MEGFANFGVVKVEVIRNGEKTEINAIDLVKGDVVKFNMGKKVPADVRLFKTNQLKVDNSSLTGESEAVSLGTLCGVKGKEDPLEAQNVAFFSTNCKEGQGEGVVIQTGSNTFMGRIADLASTAEPAATTLQHEVDSFIKMIAVVAVSFGVIFFIAGLIINYPIITNFLFAIGIIVANVPEGLISTVTVALAITAQKMFARNVLVKNLQSVETLGSITCICSDKTGTLTQNKMTVVHLWYDLELKKIKESQENIIIDRKEINMKLYSPTDPSFEIFEFAAICGSGSSFRTAVPDDYPKLVEQRAKYKTKNKNITPEQLNDYVNECKNYF